MSDFARTHLCMHTLGDVGIGARIRHLSDGHWQSVRSIAAILINTIMQVSCQKDIQVKLNGRTVLLRSSLPLLLYMHASFEQVECPGSRAPTCSTLQYKTASTDASGAAHIITVCSQITSCQRVPTEVKVAGCIWAAFHQNRTDRTVI